MGKAKQIKLTDPRKPIGLIHVGAHDRKVYKMLSREERLLKQVAYALNQYNADEIVAAVYKVSKWPKFKRRMMARYGVMISHTSEVTK